MSEEMRAMRWKQIAAWVAAGFFVTGFFSSVVGAWTGPILGVWFVGTQKPLRGFLWLTAFAFVPHLLADWRLFADTPYSRALEYLAWILLASIIDVLPLLFHRLTSPRLPGLVSTLPFPFAAAAVQILSLFCLPTAAYQFLTDDHASKLPLLHVIKGIGGGPILSFILVVIFLASWLAAVVVWMWNHEFRASKIRAGAIPFALFFLAICGYRYLRFVNDRLSSAYLGGAIIVFWFLLGGVPVLSAWAILNRNKRKCWADRPEVVAMLRSPDTGNALHVRQEGRNEALLSDSGERFPICDGIPDFLKPEDLTGDNGKYNHLYQTIGGFYDDIQRIFLALKGFDRDAYFRAYMGLLEVKAGDSVLETSVGTGLNYKYLPEGLKLSGLDLSSAMLVNCQTNLRRWGMDADLYRGNAESLPFSDNSFDVVFHVGGINFFNERAKAIHEMIRVARPGSVLLIADETEKHVKEIYEKQPGGMFKNRKEPVSAPIDLVPAEMQEVHLEELRDGQFYALTFRKPAKA